MHPLISPTRADELIATHLPDIPIISCPLDKCAGRVLREPVISDRPLPPFNRSMMDGYAIRYATLKNGYELNIRCQAPAGHPQLTIGGELDDCAEIMTGAILPADADTVVPYEDTELIAEGRIRLKVPASIEAGDCIHPMGSDHPEGSSLLKSGRLIGSREIAIAATCGYNDLKFPKFRRLPSSAPATSLCRSAISQRLIKFAVLMT